MGKIKRKRVSGKERSEEEKSFFEVRTSLNSILRDIQLEIISIVIQSVPICACACRRAWATKAGGFGEIEKKKRQTIIILFEIGQYVLCVKPTNRLHTQFSATNFEKINQYAKRERKRERRKKASSDNDYNIGKSKKTYAHITQKNWLFTIVRNCSFRFRFSFLEQYYVPSSHRSKECFSNAKFRNNCRLNTVCLVCTVCMCRAHMCVTHEKQSMSLAFSLASTHVYVHIEHSNYVVVAAFVRLCSLFAYLLLVWSIDKQHTPE